MLLCCLPAGREKNDTFPLKRQGLCPFPSIFRWVLLVRYVFCSLAVTTMKGLLFASIPAAFVGAGSAAGTCPESYEYLDRTCVANGVGDANAQQCADWLENDNCGCPDLRPYLPHHFQILNQQGQNLLRFTAGAANVPLGGLASGSPYEIVGDQNVVTDTDFCNSVIEPVERGYEDAEACQVSVQRFYAPGERGGSLGDNYCRTETTTGWAFYHASHNHWHATSIYEFTLHEAEEYTQDDGSVSLRPAAQALAESNKVTFCLIDWVSATKNNGNNGNDNTNNGNGLTNSQTAYFDCESHEAVLGISRGFMDQYHHSLDGMDFDITDILNDIPAQESKIMFIVATANPDCIYWEEDYSNNVAYRALQLKPKGKGGNFQVEFLSEYDSNTCCWDPDGEDPSMHQAHLCGENLSNH